MPNVSSIEDCHNGDSTAPSSPPDLSFRSSNSSTSSLDTDSVCGESSTDTSTHSEDVKIGGAHIDESLDDCNVKPESRPTLRRPSPRLRALRDQRRLSDGPATASTDINVRVQAAHMPSSPLHRSHTMDFPATNARTKTFPSPLPSPSHAPSSRSSNFSSRSPSPVIKRSLPQRFASTPSLPSLTPQPSWDRRPSLGSPGLTSRRTSWQPNRKTTEQLEAEYDDADEDVPDEAILTNVPITPIPGMSPIMSRRTTPSPQRRPSHTHLSGAHGNLHSANIPKHARRPVGPPVATNGQYASTRTPRLARPPLLVHSTSAPVAAQNSSSFKRRSASWAGDLNEEARKLSAALEQYVTRESSEKCDAGISLRKKRTTQSAPVPALTKALSTTSIFEVPFMQKSKTLIDPLPISKEKEAVLTRTRPSWLPPKSQKEERRHMKQWAQMMSHARDAEKRRESKQKEELEAQEEMKVDLDRTWDQHILKNWDQCITDPKMREIWWKGVPAGKRGMVWSKAVTNDLGLTASTYKTALKRALQTEAKIAKMTPKQRALSKEATWFDAIARDIPTIHPSQPIFQPGAALHKCLTDLLMAYAMYRSDVGYVHGTHLIAGNLCLNSSPAEAFVVLANIMNRPVPMAFLLQDTRAMNRAYGLVLDTLKYKFPSLYNHLNGPSADVRSSEYLDPILGCLAAYHLTPEHTSRLWDIYVFEGDKTLVRAAVAVLGKLEPQLYGSRQEILDLLSWSNRGELDLGSPDEFIRLVRDAGKMDDDRQTPEIVC